MRIFEGLSISTLSIAISLFSAAVHILLFYLPRNFPNALYTQFSLSPSGTSHILGLPESQNIIIKNYLIYVYYYYFSSNHKHSYT